MPPLLSKNFLNCYGHALSKPSRTLALRRFALTLLLNAFEVLLAPLLDHLGCHVELVVDQQLHILDAQGPKSELKESHKLAKGILTSL
jgi:hypothetical protein